MTANKQTELAMRAKSDAGALAELIADMDYTTRSVIRGMMSSRAIDDQEDVYQEVMLALCRSIKSFKCKSSFATWFRRLVFNKIYDYYRKQGRNRETLMAEAFDIDRAPAPTMESSFIYADVVAKLSKPYRTILEQLYFTGMSLPEITRAGKKNYEANCSTKRRALEYIRTSFAENELR